MKSRIKKILIGIICLAGVSAFMTLPAQAQNEERVLSSAQQWVTGIEVPGLGYRSWVTGIQPPSTVEVTEEATGIDALVDKIMSPINAVIYNAVFFSVPFLGSDLKLVVAWLVVGAVFCTVYFGLVNFRGFAQALRLVRGDYSHPNDHGEVSHFQALATALSGTVGVGNIGAVPILIVLGGPGAVFWMIVAGFLGMSSKFCECTLGVKYRNENPDGSVSGGPMYSLKKGLAQLGKPTLGKVLASFLLDYSHFWLPWCWKYVSSESGLCSIREYHRWRKQFSIR